VFALKDWIDRRFMRRFQVLAPDGDPRPEFAGQAKMGAGDEMLCGGCAAKVGESVLSRALERIGAPLDPAVLLGLHERDDVAAVATPRGEVIVSSVDSFRAFTDDPYLVGPRRRGQCHERPLGQGRRPALRPGAGIGARDRSRAGEESLYQVCRERAPRSTRSRSHSSAATRPRDPSWSRASPCSAWPMMRRPLMRVGGLAPGDRLILTKPLGTGVLFQADMRGLARGEWMERALASMARSNADASRVAREMAASAVTDVTGFGLAGHLGQMLRASKASAVIDLGALPLLPGVASLLARGIRSTFHDQNTAGRRGIRIAAAAAAHPAVEVVFDPQTSGGLLFGARADQVTLALDRLRAVGDPSAAVIGEVTPPHPDGALFELVLSTHRQP
jgi:selenide,water dikinase